MVDKEVRKLRKLAGRTWRMNETYIKINGKWVYLYRTVDSCDNTIEFLLRKYRDAVTAKAFFRITFRNNGIPDKVTIDKSGSNTCALNDFNESRLEE